jgi:hypothetical protein
VSAVFDDLIGELGRDLEAPFRSKDSILRRSVENHFDSKLEPNGAVSCRRFLQGAGAGLSLTLGENGGTLILETALRATIPGFVQPPVSSSGKLRPRPIQASQRSLLAVFNETDQTQTAPISLPAGYRRASDIYSGKEYGITANKMELSVPFRYVSVFNLE